MTPAVALLLLVAAPGAASASQQGLITIQKWKMADLCAKKAQAAFPDFTPEANAKREAALNDCLEGQNLPARAPETPR